MNQIKIFKLLLLVGVLATAHINSSAQVCGYGVGNLITGTTSHGSGKFYTDNTRAEVDNITFNGTFTAATVKVYNSNAYKYGTFSTGDEVLLIQMEGSSGHPEGVHMNATITAITTPSGETNYFLTPSGVGTCTNFPSSLTHNLGTGGNEVLQLIKINNYEDFTLNGGVVTCHDWDGHTGGVLSIVVTDSLTINGGYFDVSGKGYFDNAITWGTGGSGGTGSSTSNGLGSTATSTAILCVNGVYNSTPTSVTHTGVDGGTVTSANDGGTGSNNSGSTKARTSANFNDKATPGQPGSGASTQNGGVGAQGGAAGGDGGDNTTSGCTANGTAGDAGENGGDGGDVGKSGKGAGSIIIKVAGIVTVNGSVSGKKLLWAVGENGEHAEGGGKGGEGGIGGDGATPCCSSSVSIICGNGGSGEGGIGGGGGDGGNGGKGGVIWVASQGTNGLSSTNVTARGGYGGSGGPGGWGYSGTPTGATMRLHDPCDVGGAPCTSGGGGSCTSLNWCTYEICDAEKVFCTIAQNTVSAVFETGSSTNVIFSDGVNPTGWYRENSGTTGFAILWAYVDDPINFIHYKYYTLLYTQDVCNDIFKSFVPYSSSGGFPDPNETKEIDFSLTTSNCPVTLGGWADVDFFVNGITDPSINYYQGTITDLLTPGKPTCRTMFCPPANLSAIAGNGITVETAGSGLAGDPGVSSDNVDGDINLQGSASWKMLPTGVKNRISIAQQIRTYPNPASKSIVVELPGLKTSGNCTVELMDITGKVVYTTTYTAQAGGKYTVDVQSLARGVYTIKVITPGIDAYTSKITLQ